MDAATIDPTSTTAPADASQGASPRRTAFNHGDSFGFSDLLDILNPLQHIPIVNAIYRRVTGDSEGTASDLIGGALWGTVVGLAAAAGDQALENDTGKTSGDHLISFLFGDDTTATDTRMAAAEPVAATAAVSPPAPVISESLPAANPAAMAETAGDTLVFGGAALPSAAPVANVGVGRVTTIGDMMVFGGTASAPQRAAAPSSAAQTPTSLLPDPASAAPATIVSAPATSAVAANPTAVPQSAAATPARTYPVAFRRGPASPSTIMPMPTTGPAALPGHSHSLATGTSAPAAAAVTLATDTPEDPAQQLGDQSWFVAQFNAAMDKYQKAARLGGSGDGIAPTTGD